MVKELTCGKNAIALVYENRLEKIKEKITHHLKLIRIKEEMTHRRNG